MVKISINPESYLSRLALAATEDTELLNPHTALQSFFEIGPPSETRYQFQLFCEAALSPVYSWSTGSPGNLLFFAEKLELLIEACYLINQEKGKSYEDLLFAPENTKQLSVDMAISAFFRQQTLAQWKKTLHDWQEAALSNFSINNEYRAEEIVRFGWMLDELMEAAWRLIAVEMQ